MFQNLFLGLFQDGSSNPLVPSERVKIDPKTGNIFFNPLKKEDEGKYTCLAHNDVGNSTSDGEITVNGKYLAFVHPKFFTFELISLLDFSGLKFLSLTL